MRSRCNIKVGMAVVCALGALSASVPLTADAQSEAARKTEEVTALIDVKPAVTKAIAWFREVAGKDPNGWFIRPYDNPKVVGYKDVEYRYREEEVPVYEYESYQELAPSSDPSKPMQMVTRQRVKRVIPGKTQKTLVSDPKGPIARVIKTPIYEKGGHDIWVYGGLGSNAMILYALRACGVRPDDPLVARPAENLANLVDDFGLPDLTWDLAWMSAAFATLPDERFAVLSRRMSGKLLDAQEEGGVGDGLWGPIALNTALLARSMETTLRLGAEKSALEKEIDAARVKGKGLRESSRLEKKIEPINRELAAIQAQVTAETMAGLSFFGLGSNPQQSITGPQGKVVVVLGLPYYFYNQTCVDLESTALALMALRVAAEHDCLPAKTERSARLSSPTKGGKINAVPAPRTPAEVGHRALNALKKLRSSSGGWTELNAHYPNEDFAFYSVVPKADRNSFKPLSSSNSFASAAQGAAAYLSAQFLAGEKSSAVPVQHPVCRQGIEAAVTGTPKSKAAAEPGGVFDAVAFLGRNQTQAELRKPFPAESWNEMARWLLSMQTVATGSWGSGLHSPLSSSLRARAQVIAPITPAEMGKALSRPNLSPSACMWRENWRSYYCQDATLYATAATLIFLSDALDGSEVPLPPEPAAKAEEAAAPEPAAAAAGGN